MRNVRLKLLPILCTIVLAQASVANGQTLDDSLRSDIRELLKVTGSAQLGRQAASLISGQILDSLKKSQPSIPARAWELARQVLDSEFAKAFEGPDGLTEQMIPVYAAHFTREDIGGLLAFYTSDLGKKAIVSMPAILQEGAAAGQRWAETQLPLESCKTDFAPKGSFRSPEDLFVADHSLR
jgi:hypothetical protein